MKNDFRYEAQEDAKAMVSEFKEEIIRQLIINGVASNDCNNDYPNGDSYHHECHIDRWYSLTEAAQLLDDLSEFEEGDSGLWEGQLPREAISTQAAFTYGNAVAHYWDQLIEEINERISNYLDEVEEEEREMTDDEKETEFGYIIEEVLDNYF